MASRNQDPRERGATEHYDVVIIGAGVSGMYALHHFREMGLSVRVYDGASDVGGCDPPRRASRPAREAARPCKVLVAAR